MSLSALVTRFAPAVAGALVRGLGGTLRVETTGSETLAPLWLARRPLIYIVWHGRILLIPWVNWWLRRTRGARPVCVLASRSRDGEIMARYVRAFGLTVVRGSSSRGGVTAIRQLTRALSVGDDVALVPDGPRGPRVQLQPGVIALAALSGAPVVPVAFAARHAWRLSTWDEFLIPLPFSRCAVVFGAPVSIAATADRARAGKALEQALNEVTATADALVAR